MFVENLHILFSITGIFIDVQVIPVNCVKCGCPEKPVTLLDLNQDTVYLYIHFSITLLFL